MLLTFAVKMQVSVGKRKVCSLVTIVNAMDKYRKIPCFCVYKEAANYQMLISVTVKA